MPKTPVPSATAARSAAPVDPAARRDAILRALDIEIPPLELPPGYGLAMTGLVVYLVLLATAYAALVAFLGWLLVWHVVQAVLSLREGPYFLFHLPMALLGGMLLLFLIKPVFLRRKSGDDGVIRLNRDDEPLLFDFVEKLCAATGAREPAAIEIDCDANASARRAGAFDKNLILRFGLPVVSAMSVRQFAGVLAHELGHFNQRGGMAGSYFIRVLSGFFAKIVFERDRLDEKLARLRASPAILSRVIFWTAGWLVEAARGVLWLMLVTAELFTCGALRRMEYDADRLEAHVAGCRDFVVTSKLMLFLSIAARRARYDLADAWEQRRLADDLPALIVAHARQLAEHKTDILKHLREQQTRWFDTHPCHNDRVSNVEATGATGLVACDVAAKHLFSNFAAVSRMASLAFYRTAVGDDLDQGKLVPTRELVDQRKGERQSFDALRRFFRGAAAPTRPLLPGADAARPGRPGEAAALTNELAAARDEMVARAAAAEGCAAQYETSNGAVVLGHAKIKFGTLFASTASVRMREEAQAELQHHEPLRLKCIHELIPFEKAARRRLTAALRLAQTPPWSDEADAPAASTAAADRPRSPRTVARLTRVCAALQPHLEKVERLRELAFHIRIYMGAYDDAQPYPPLVRRILQAGEDVVGAIDALKSDLDAIPYPFAHATQGICVGAALIPMRPDPQNPGDVHATALTIVDRFYDLLYRTLAELTTHAERIERGIGLAPLPDLPSNDEKDKEAQAGERDEERRDARRYWTAYGLRAAGGVAMLAALVVFSIRPPALPSLGWPSASRDTGERYTYRPSSFHFTRRSPSDGYFTYRPTTPRRPEPMSVQRERLERYLRQDANPNANRAAPDRDAPARYAPAPSRPRIATPDVVAPPARRTVPPPGGHSSGNAVRRNYAPGGPPSPGQR